MSGKGIPDITVSARVSNVIGIKDAIEVVERVFRTHSMPLTVDVDGKKIQAQLLDLQKKNFIDPNTRAVTEYMTATVKAADSLQKIRMKYKPKDEENNPGFWTELSVSVASAADEMKKYHAEAEKVLGKISKSVGKPKEMDMWIKKLDKAKQAIFEFGQVMDSVEQKRISSLPLEETLGGTKKRRPSPKHEGSKLAKEYLKDLDDYKKIVIEQSTAVAVEKLQRGTASLEKAYKDYYDVYFNKKISPAARDKQLKQMELHIKNIRKSIMDTYKTTLADPDDVKIKSKDLNARRMDIKSRTREDFRIKEANAESRTYLGTLNDLYNKKMDLVKAEASLANPKTKKKETADYISTLKQEIAALDRKTEKQKQIMIAGGMSAQQAELMAAAERKHNIEVAKFNAKGKAQMTVLQDIANGFKQAAARVINYTLVYRSLWFAIGLGKQAIATIKELNEAMVNIRMVTGTSVESNMKLMQSYNKLAIQLGATTAEVSKAAIEYLRQGRTVAETNQLIEASMVLSKVGFIDSASATEYLTSTMNGYKMSVSDVMRIVDAMSQVDVKAATSVQELAVALQRSANSGRNAGVEFERLLGYVGSVSETTRRSAETIGEAFKTMFARMQNIKVGRFVDEETDEPLNDVEKALNKLNISLRSSENIWRPLGDVLDDINDKWDTLNQTERSAIAVSIAGVRQREIFLALMDSYDRALVLEQEALNSGGAAMKKYEAYQNGIAAAQNRLKATFESIVFTQFNQTMYKLLMLDVPKFFLDIAKALKLIEIGVLVGGVTFFNMAIDRLKLSYASLTQTMAFYQNQAAINAVSNTLFKTTTDLATVSVDAQTMALMLYNKEQLRKILISKGVTGTMIEEVFAQTQLTYATVGNTTANGFLIASLGALKAAFLSNPLLWIGAILWGAIQLINIMTTSIEEQSEKVQSLTSELSNLQNEYDNLKDKKDLNKSEEAYLSLLERQIELREESLRIAKEELFIKMFRRRAPSIGANSAESPEESPEIIYTSEDNKRSILKKNMQDLYDLYEKLNNNKLDESQYEEINNQLVELESNYSNAVIALMNARDAGIELNSSEEELIENYIKFVEQYKKKTGSLADEIDVVESTALAISNASNSVSKFKDEIGKLASVLDEFNEAGELSAQTVLDLASENSSLLEYITLENGQYKLNADALRIRFELLKANTLADLYAQQAMFKNADALRTQRDEYIKLAMATSDATQAMTYYALIAALNNDIADNSGWDTLNSTIKLIEGMTFESFISGANSSSTGVDKLQKKIDKLNDTLKEQEELLDKLKEKNEAILDAILKVIDDELEALDTQKEETEKLYDDQISALEDSIDLIKEQADEEDRLLKLEEARLDVIKKQQALSDVLAQKNTRVYKTGLGWVFDVDPAAVKSAEEDLEESQNNYDELLKEMERDDAIKALQDQIDALEDAKEAAVTLIEDQIEALKDLKEQWADSLKIEADLTQYEGALEFLAEFESASYASRLAMMTSFKSQYASQYDAYMSQINDTKAALAELEKQQDKVNAKNGGGNFKIDEVDPAAKQAEEDAARKIIWNGLVQKAREHYTNKDYEEMGEVTAKLRALLQSDPGFYSQGIDPNVKGWEMFKQFRQGGNVSYTGPAMVHGTPSKPEFMLNAQELPIVRNLFAKMGLGGNSFQRTPMSNGSNTFVINELNVSAPNEATIETILQSAMMLAKTGRG